MRNNLSALKRIFGFLLLATSTAALVLSIVGLSRLSGASQQLRTSSTELVATTLSAVQITRQSLTTANNVLEKADTSLSVVTTTVEDVGGTLQDTDDLVGNLGSIAGENLPEVIGSTQESLVTAQESAQVIEGVLRTLNGLSFLTGVSYNPDIPMPESIGEISSTLDGLTPAFEDMQDNLEVLQANLSLVESNVSGLSESLDEIQTSIGEAETLITDYDVLLEEIENNLENASERIDNSIRTATWIAGFFIIWLIVAQIALIMRGWEYITQKE
ncbi:MAG: hypothetical protein HND51_05470 [Chloroflexi bacterium]|nr:hypothetical protein [Chloroflexota bacterium]